MELAKIEGAELVIRIPVEAFAIAPLVAFDRHFGFGEHSYAIADVEVFAREVVRELNDEAEDGTTAVHLMLDRACIRAVENGAEGVSE